MDPLHDPETVRDDPGVAAADERTVDDPDAFAYFEPLAGMVAVGVTNEAGAVLLMNGPHGWRLPYGPVDAGANWTAEARHIGGAVTGQTVEPSDVARVTRIERRHADDESRTTTTHDVVVRAGPVTATPVADDPTFAPREDLAVGWFDTVPTDAYHDHGDAVPDIRRVLE